MKTIKRALAIAIAILVAATRLPAAAADETLPLWQIDGSANTVYLLGSVHLLREQDYPLAAEIEAAYRDADTLIMELDMDDLDQAEMQALVVELGSIADGGSLAGIMGEELYAEIEALAASINIPLPMLAGVEPWLAAITIEQLMLQRIGFDPAFGIEMHFLQKAGDDGKDILGLEDIAEQLGFLDALSLNAQRSLLLQTLTEAVEIGPMMDGLVAAWQRGDVAYLEENLLEGMREYPELYEAIVSNRNVSWVERIDELLDDDQDYLIIVGALHLVGDDSVPALLSAEGHDVRQLRRAER